MPQREREVGGKTRPKSAFLGAATTELQEVSIIISNINIIIIIMISTSIKNVLYRKTIWKVASEVRRQRPLSTGEVFTSFKHEE